MKKGLIIFIALLLVAACSSSKGPDASSSATPGTVNLGSETNPLKNVRFFMYQIQGLNEDSAVDNLAATHYDMLVVEPTATVVGDEDFDMAGMVNKLKYSSAKSFKNKLVFAYVDIGEAEEYRTYWQAGWKAPASTDYGNPGTPDFIVRQDPDGWSENYPVAFWNIQWVTIMKDVFKKLADTGFDGAYLDWVEAYQDDCVKKKALADGVADTAEAMVNFVKTLKDYARTINPNFMLISQNAIELGRDKSAYLNLIEGLGVEDTFFGGKADTDWGLPEGGDIMQYPFDTDYYLNVFKNVYLSAGVPVFSIDYALKPENVDKAYTEALKNGLIPLVTQVSLSQITTTPPPGY